MGTVENTKLCDFTSTNNNDFLCTPIAPPATAAEFFEIKPALLNLVMREQFSGVSSDNAIKKPLGRIDNVRIMVNNNLVPVDFLSWILNAMHLVPLYWEDLFFELLVLPSI